MLPWVMLAALTRTDKEVTFTVKGVVFHATLEPKAARPLTIWKGKAKVTQGLLARFHPWGLQAADVDGQGPCLAIGVTKPTHNLPFPHRTLFLLSFNGHELKRKWTGSTMGRPLLEFGFTRGTPAHLVTLERTLHNSVALSAYKWNGFGFTKTGHERGFGQAHGLTIVGNEIRLIADGHEVSFTLDRLLK